MKPWQKILSYAGGITTLVVCLELLMPHVFNTVSTTQSMLSTPHQIKITDSLVRYYAGAFEQRIARQDSILDDIVTNRNASHMFQVGLRADTNHVLWYRNRHNEVHRVLYDSANNYYYARTIGNELNFHYCFKNH